MRSSSAARNTIALLALPLLVAGPAKASPTVYIAPSEASTSNATWTGGGTSLQNYGIAFTTGASGPFAIEGINLGLNSSSSTATSGSLTFAIHGTNNSTPYSAVANTTAYATDTVSFTMPGTASTNFTLNLVAADLPNITAYQLLSSSSYALIAYAPSQSIGIQRTTGYANGTTNTKYTVAGGFTMLDTFRNSTANYTNTANSYPSLHFSLLGSASAPSTAVPGPLSVLGALAGFRASRQLRKRLRASKPGSTTSTTA
jgi:hypothetical protein